MSPPRRTTASLLFLLPVLALAGCGDGSTEPETPDFEGVWVGTTSGNRSVRMVVGPTNRVDSLLITVRLTVGGGTCTGPLVLSDPVTIQGNGFSAETLFPGSNVVSQVSATFGSGSVSGTYSGHSGPFSLVCGNSFSVGTGSILSSGTWTATKN